MSEKMNTMQNMVFGDKCVIVYENEPKLRKTKLKADGIVCIKKIQTITAELVKYEETPECRVCSHHCYQDDKYYLSDGVFTRNFKHYFEVYLNEVLNKNFVIHYEDGTSEVCNEINPEYYYATNTNGTNSPSKIRSLLTDRILSVNKI